MPDDLAPLHAAMARYRKAQLRLDEAKAERDRQIIVALGHAPQVLVCEVTGLTREQIRRISLRGSKHDQR